MESISIYPSLNTRNSISFNSGVVFNNWLSRVGDVKEFCKLDCPNGYQIVRYSQLVAATQILQWSLVLIIQCPIVRDIITAQTSTWMCNSPSRALTQFVREEWNANQNDDWWEYSALDDTTVVDLVPLLGYWLLVPRRCQIHHHGSCIYFLWRWRRVQRIYVKRGSTVK